MIIDKRAVIRGAPDHSAILNASEFASRGLIALRRRVEERREDLRRDREAADLAGVVSVHGSLQTSRPAQRGDIRAKILVCHGALDPHGPMTHVIAFAEEMTRAGVDWQLVIYGEAMHGFTHETATGQQRGVAYHALSDRRSAIAIQTFLNELFA